MAIDKIWERHSATFMLQPGQAFVIKADGTVGATDRASAAWMFGGILGGGGPVASGKHPFFYRRKLWR